MTRPSGLGTRRAPARAPALRFLLLFLLPLLLLGPSATSPASADGLSCDRVPELLKAYLNKHYSFRYLNDELRKRTMETYVKRIDPSKSLFLIEEAAALEKQLQGVFHDIRRGDCSALLEIRLDVIARYEGAENFVREYVNNDDYELDTSVELIIDPDRRARPRSSEDQDDLYRRLIHFQMSNYLSNGEELSEAKRKLTHRYELMTRRARELEEQDVYGAFLDSFASALDPHSNYFTAEAVEDFQIGMELSLEGIGVALTSRDGYSVVERIIPDGAAAKAGGLEPKDKIIAVAQAEGEFVDIIDMDLRDVVRLIRGKRGTTVRLSILRQKDATERFVVSIVRAKIKLEDQAAALRFEQVSGADGQSLKLAVLELPSFYGGRNPTERQSSRDMRELLRKVKEEKADGLLLDLSRNGGGLLENSVEIAGFFIRNGGVVAVKDTYSKVQVLRDPDDSLLYGGPMVLLTSRVSASASEIVAGAMKDYRRAIVVGDDHTFGKGTVQSMVNLPQDLGALKVTTALFFRPGGNSTQHGVCARTSCSPRSTAPTSWARSTRTTPCRARASTPSSSRIPAPAWPTAKGTRRAGPTRRRPCGCPSRRTRSPPSPSCRADESTRVTTSPTSASRSRRPRSATASCTCRTSTSPPTRRAARRRTGKRARGAARRLQSRPRPVAAFRRTALSRPRLASRSPTAWLRSRRVTPRLPTATTRKSSRRSSGRRCRSWRTGSA